jgi:acetyl-CoA carboxylase biotin carboxyl carrier protein
MKPKEIQELLDFIASSGLAEVNIETEDFKINVKRNAAVLQQLQSLTTTVPAVAPLATLTAPVVVAPVSAAPVVAPIAVANDKLVTVKSPMIGTCYRSPKPELPALVNIGDKVSKGKVLCIVEAMKLFNEIECEYDGTIVEILIDNATPVEFDQPLFIIELN